MTDIKLKDHSLLRTEAFINGEWRRVRDGEGVFEVISKLNNHVEVGIVTSLIVRQIQRPPIPYRYCLTSARMPATTPSMELGMPQSS